MINGETHTTAAHYCCTLLVGWQKTKKTIKAVLCNVSTILIFDGQATIPTLVVAVVLSKGFVN